MSALTDEAREWRKTALPPTPWGDNHIVLRLADEVDSLTAQLETAQREMHSRELHHFESEEMLEAAQATIAEARNCIEQADQGDSFGPIEDILSRADTSTHDAAIKAARVKELRDAAAQIPEQMRTDELAIHQLDYTHQLPQLSQVMLNGGTRFAERLVARAASIEQTEADR